MQSQDDLRMILMWVVNDRRQKYGRDFDNRTNGVGIDGDGENCRWSRLGREYEEPSVTCGIGSFFYVHMQVSSTQCYMCLEYGVPARSVNLRMLLKVTRLDDVTKGEAV